MPQYSYLLPSLEFDSTRLLRLMPSVDYISKLVPEPNDSNTTSYILHAHQTPSILVLSGTEIGIRQFIFRITVR